VSFIALGTCTVDANQAGNGEYGPAPQEQQSFTVSKRSQHIDFTSSAPGSAAVGGPVYAMSVTATSGLVVSLSSGTPSVCSLSGSTVSFVAAGICTVDANQAGDASYQAAPEAQQSFTVDKHSQLVTFTSSAPSSATVGGPIYAVSAAASSKLTVDFSSGTPSVCSLAGAVTNASTAEPINGVEVCAYTEYLGGGSGCTKTEPNGEYAIAGLKAGEYRVEFSTRGRNYLPQFYDGKAASSEAQLVSVTAGQTTSGIDAGLQEGAQITGNVGNATTQEAVDGLEVCAIAVSNSEARCGRQSPWPSLCARGQDSYAPTPYR
jgi:hypothetical protein